MPETSQHGPVYPEFTKAQNHLNHTCPLHEISVVLTSYGATNDDAIHVAALIFWVMMKVYGPFDVQQCHPPIEPGDRVLRWRHNQPLTG